MANTTALTVEVPPPLPPGKSVNNQSTYLG